jgi:PAS domain S-box-containing protein
MKALRNLAIQQKMLCISLLICGAVLVLAVGSLFLYQVFNFRSQFETDTATLATIIANNSTAAMDFKDAENAAEIIRALQAKSSVISATLATPDGVPFVSFGYRETRETLGQFPGEGKSKYVKGHLLVTRAVVAKGNKSGILLLRAEYRRSFTQLVSVYAVVVCGILAAATLLAVLLTRALGRRITGPIIQLARTAEVIGEKKDYSLRAAVPLGRDEVSRLTESFNQMVGRIQSQDAELSLSQRKMEALVHSIDGIVWERTPETFQFTFVSRQTETILGYAAEEWLDDTHFWENRLEPQDAAKTIKAARELTAKSEPYTLEYRMVARDGRLVWVRESGTVLIENGRAVAVRGIFQDVTRAKEDAVELDKLNRQLMTTSRMAGMAEVATGVLHNVGNVLNSLSVSATIVADAFRNSKLTKLKRAADMLRDKNGHLADFLANDPKGKLVPEYIVTVVDQMSGEEARLYGHVRSVGTHIEHIKEIVAMQQSYAKVSGVFENLEVAALVDDALRMNAAAFDRHGITLKRDFAPGLPLVCVDRHKVLQILINLIRNAKYAMDAQGAAAKNLLVRVWRETDGFVHISVKDNGIGILADNLKKIFNHGFTTKKDGHGFGLHSGANAAIEMGGKLTAHSEGLGRGAEFILELPTSAVREPQAQLVAAHN